MDIFRATMTLVALLLVCSCNKSSGSQLPQGPNVIVIVADDLGNGDLGCYGSTLIRTPHMDQLAAEGRCFDDAHTPASVCSPTRYGLLTGRYAWRSRLKNWIVLESHPLLIEPGRETLATMFRRRGYRTGCVGKWHLGWGKETAPDWSGELKPGPLEAGFESYFGVPYSHNSPPELEIFVRNRRVVGLKPGERLEDPEVLDRVRRQLPDTMTELTSEAVRFIEHPTKRPFFLYLPTTNVHWPHTPHQRFNESSDAGVYGDFVVELDWAVGELLAALDRQGLRENTLVILTSDNGSKEEWGENGHRPNGPWRGGKGEIYEGGHRVPFIARWPGEIPAGTRSSQTICLTDLLATMAEVTGTKLPPGTGEDSYNVLSALRGEDGNVPLREATVHHSVDGTFAIRAGRWKLVELPGSGFPTMTEDDWEAARASVEGLPNRDIDTGELGEWNYHFPPPPDPGPGEPPGQLFDLVNDPEETTNVWDRHPDVVYSLFGLLNRYQREERSAPVNS